MNEQWAGPLVVARCCRDWPVFAWLPIGKCGDCGDRPIITDAELEKDEAGT